MKTEGDMPDNYVNFYIQVDDLDDLQVSLDSAVAKGGQIVMSPTPIPEMGAYAIFCRPGRKHHWHIQGISFKDLHEIKAN